MVLPPLNSGAAERHSSCEVPRSMRGAARRKRAEPPYNLGPELAAQVKHAAWRQPAESARARCWAAASMPSPSHRLAVGEKVGVAERLEPVIRDPSLQPARRRSIPALPGRHLPPVSIRRLAHDREAASPMAGLIDGGNWVARPPALTIELSTANWPRDSERVRRTPCDTANSTAGVVAVSAARGAIVSVGAAADAVTTALWDSPHNRRGCGA